MSLALLPLCEVSGSLGFVRGEDGCGIYESLGDEPSPSLVYAFNTGEVWAINAWCLGQLKDRIVLEENKFAESLKLCADFLDRLGILGPYHWIAGMEGVKGRFLVRENLFRRWGPCMMDVIEEEGIHKPGDKAAESLRPFFEGVFDQCGAQRPGGPQQDRHP
jgi:hypothetical protein